MIPSALTAQLQQGIADFLRYSFWSSTPGMEHVIDDLLAEPGGVTKGPYLSVKLPFVQGRNPNFFPKIPLGFPPHAHQEQAFERLGGHRKQSTLIATGTGSGKTECFLLPILDHCREETGTQGIKAILIYPMNALATDQAERIAALIHDNPELNGHVTAGLYIGESKGKKRVADEKMGPRNVITDREVMEKSPPDILLTNYKMLDLLLLRPWVQRIWRNNVRGLLRFLVVDELHTFDGAQGTDLACLVRRLKRRLQADDGSLCCVGTSATLGGDDSRKQLLAYAEQVFGEPFDEAALVGESRLSAAEFLGGGETESDETPGAGDIETLLPEKYDDPIEWVKAQVGVWFGDLHEAETDAEWAVELGRRLKGHSVFRALLDLLDGKVVSLDDAVQSLSRARSEWRENPELGRAAVNSLMGLISVARSYIAELPELQKAREARGEPPRNTHFLDVRLQLWQREMRRMVATVESRPRLRFLDDLDKEQKRSHLPVVHCRDCGAMGWGTRIDRDKEHLLRCDTSTFYAAFFRADPRVRFLYPRAAAPVGDPVWDNRPRLQVDSKELISLGPEDEPEGELVELVACANTRNDDGEAKLHRDCPFCDARESLALVGFRAATLTSTYIDQLFASRFNDERDKKLLTFSDSVQDAAHRAGFFGARTWRTNLRVALRHVIEDSNEGALLADVPAAFVHHWRKQLDDETWVSTFIAPNMVWLHDWDILQREGRLPEGSDLKELVAKRLTFEIATEFGHQATIGRSLPRTGAATVYIDPEKLNAASEAMLEPLRNEVPGLRDVSPEQVRRFALGLLHHLRMRGGIHHAQVPPRYLESGGKDIYVFKQWVHLPAFGKTSRLPAFLTNKLPAGRFDTWTGSSSKALSWYEHWLSRCLYENDALGAEAMATYPVLMPILVSHGLLKETESTSNSKVWGVADEALRVTTDVVTLRCGRCDHQQPVARVEIDDWKATPCLTGRCDGRYEVDDTSRVDYFGRLYANGDLQRIYTAEHTGLLSREERETIERQFKAENQGAGVGATEGKTARQPWYPNLLSCTQTLEMGIDIGDLSSAILCSVPPTQASYLQRIGRAGRRDGNSFVMTLAGARPHDLYFYAVPDEMMEGDVMPPGVFLDASAVIERQLTAFCFDRWVAGEGERAVLPGMLKDVFTRLGDEGTERFPHNLLGFIEREQPSILREFGEMFGGAVSESTRQHLRTFLMGDDADEAGLRWRILDVIQREKKQVDSLQAKAQQVGKAIKKLKDDEAKPQDYEERLARLEDEKEALLALVGQIRQRTTLEFLTDEGMLPNYAFPESAVRLSSVIWRRKKRTPSEGSKYDTWTYEYARSPSSALSDLAPGADFYAGGRRVQVDQVDVSVSEIETWRFCDTCSHAQRDDIGERSPSCPACGSTNWVDDEQKLRLLPLRQVFANSPDRESRIRDDRDERQPRHFLRQVLVEHHDVDVEKAWSIDEPSLPFGFEYLKRATFRDLNFGENAEQGQRRSIAGRDAVRPGFQICTRCGKVQPRKGEPIHTLSCPTKTRGETPSIEDCLYLYREFSSEALRLLLPMADLGTKKQLNSFLAALQLGLRERFGGSVEHINTTVYSEPDPDSSLRRQYLVLFDSVPGGTGYVKQLVTPAREGANLPLYEALVMARQRIEGCTCWSDPDRDGCYRCLLGYRNARDMDDTSARTAVELIGRILGHWEKLEPVSSLSDVSVGGLMDSVLEARFLEALRQTSHKGRANRLKGVIFREKSCHHLTVGEQEWNVEPQCAVEHSSDFHITRPIDFMLWPASAEARERRRPIAVFLDGFEYHKDRIGLDLLQRQCLIASGRFDVWSLTWYDLDQALGIPTRKPANLLHPYLSKLRAALKRMNVGEVAEIGERALFDLFLDELARPEPVSWETVADTVLASRMRPAGQDDANKWKVAVDAVAPVAIRTLLDVDAVQHALADEGELNQWVRLYAVHDGDGARVIVEIDDTGENWGAQGFLEAWNGFLHLYQVMRLQPAGWFVARRWRERPEWSSLVRLRSGPEDGESWAAESGADDPFLWLCGELANAGAPSPEVGVDIPDTRGGVWTEGELVWEERQVAITDKPRVDNASGQAASSWQVFVLEELESAVPVLEALGIEGGG